jgi:hypothetical protein
MIPDFDLGNVLPPFLCGDVVGQFLPRSPFSATMLELVETLATSPERAAILRGFRNFRDAARGIGFTNGFQWIDGSFVEACEIVNGRPPGDLDVVSVLSRPPAHAGDEDWQAFVLAHQPTLFDPDYCKANYSCDAYFIDLGIVAQEVSEQTAYWFGLFSHQRDTFRWKGLVQLDFNDDDQAAMDRLTEIEATW